MKDTSSKGNASSVTNGMNKKEVEKLAELSQIKVSESDAEKFAGEIDDILGFVSEVQQATGDEVEKAAGAHRNILREDENPNAPGEFTDALLKNAPETQDGYIKVKKIL